MANERPTKRQRRSWSFEEKSKLADEARGLRERGVGWAEIGRRLDARPASIQLWMKQMGPRLLPVTIEPSPTPKRSTKLVLVTLEGFRVEGLNVDSVHELLEYLRC